MHYPHRAWAVCAGGAIMLFVVVGLGCNVFSVYQPYVIAWNGFTNAQGSWIITVRSLFIVIGMITANWVLARMGLRRMAVFSVGLAALSCFLFGAASDFFLCCAAGALTGLSYGWGGMIPVSLLIHHWFQDRQVFALGLASAGSGLSTILAPAPLTWLIEHRGLSAAFWFEGAFILLLALLVLLLVQDRPENLGLLPYHLGGEAAPIQPARSAPSGMTQRRWAMVLLAIFLIGGPTGIGISHVGVLYASEGYNSGTVAVLVSWIGVWLIVGKLIYGELTDRLGSRRSNYLLYGLALASFLLFCLAPLGGIMPAFAAVTTFGLGMPISNVALSTWARDLRGDAGFAEGLRWSQTLYALGLLLTGPIPGILADATGSYVPSYVLFFLMMLLSMSLLLWVYGRTRAGDIPVPHP